MPISRRRRAAPQQRVESGPEPPVPSVEGEPVESREERIARIRKLIQEGKYHPDPYEVARAMMERGGLT